MSASTSTQKSPTKSCQPGRTNLCSPLYYDDLSDRKSLDALVETLISKQKEAAQTQKSSSSTSKYRQLSMSSYCHGSVPKRESKTMPKPESKRGGGGSGSKRQVSSERVSGGKINKRTKLAKKDCLPKLDGWISKKPKDPVKDNVPMDPDTVKTKKEVLLENVNTNKNTKKETKKFKRQSSGSFDKYGMRLPSFEDILAYQKKFQDEKECVDSINIEDSQESLELNIEDEPETPQIVLDCKHLTGNEIQKTYKDNSLYVSEIFNGMRYSLRHEQFKNQKYKDHFTAKDLKYSTSTIVFSSDQKQQLLRYLHEQFDNEDCLPNQYLFKVLLPELCLKIFMDTHKMSYKEATAYLNNALFVID